MQSGELSFEQSDTYDNPENSGNIYVLINKKASGVKQIRQNLGELMLSDYGPRIERIYTEGDFDKDVQTVTDELRPGDKLLIGGGEYTARVGVRALISDELFDSEIEMLLLRGGDGADGSRMTIGRKYKDHPSRALTEGYSEEAFPFLVKIKNSEEITHYPLAYFGVGNFARMVKIFGSEEFRLHPLYQSRTTRTMLQAMHSLKHFPERESFLAEDSSGNIKELYEFFVANGRRIAKFGDLPIKLENPEAWVAELRKYDDKIIDNAYSTLWLGRLAAGLPQGYRKHNLVTTKLTVHSDTDMHIDGDHEHLPAGSKIEISRSPRSVKLIVAR